ncbi:MAG: hypothetical protein Q8N51_16475, partial [Gammaproteobacteria bacterium]|nr:hypothetical protein [Gammaproteobacteria bacterium]
AIVAPVAPIPVKAPVSMNELTTILIKHYGLHKGRYDLLVEYQIGVGPVGPNPASLVPGVMFGFGRVGLLEAKGDGPTSVDAAVVNPAPVKQKKVAVAAAKATRKKPAG